MITKYVFKLTFFFFFTFTKQSKLLHCFLEEKNNQRISHQALLVPRSLIEQRPI